MEINKNIDVNEASRIYILPSLFTSGNLFFGFLSIIRCIQAKYTSINEIISKEYYTQAVWFILIAFLCDALDGRVARSTNKDSYFGKEFDSIADIVSFGVAPSLMVFFLILSPTEGYPVFRQIGWIIGFIYLLCGAVRLARFNVVTHPLLATSESNLSNNFKGLPIPVAAGAIASLVLVLNKFDLSKWSIILPFLMLLIAWLMVSSIPYPSFKKLDSNTHVKHKVFLLLVILVALIFIYREITLVVVFLSYIFFGLFLFFKNNLKLKNLIKPKKRV